MKDSKNVYELLNQMDFDIQDYEREDLSDIERKRLKVDFRRRNRRKVNLKKVTAIAVTLILAVGIFSRTSFGKNVYATAQSKVSEISYSIGKALNIERNIEPYANVVDQIAENKGVEIKLTDVIIDKDELIFSTIINTNQPMDGFHFNYHIFVNGKKLKNYGAIGSAGAIDGFDNLFFETCAVDIKEIDTDENVDIKIVLKDLSYYYVGDRMGELKEGESIERERIKGKWEFEFNANGKELMAKTHALPIDYSFSIDDAKYVLEEFRYNPVNQKIYGRIKNKSKDSYAVDLRGHDDLGNEVVFYLGTLSSEDLIFRYSNIDGDLSDEIKSITLTPYAAKYPKRSGRMNSEYKQVGEKFTVFLNK
ncbi:MAG TPA: DUF4179 domain-containing protein [Oscillospiraceae bacterium]|nr:DUF4179 domain-containing protein [Oscillospiraceae bacterium]